MKADKPLPRLLARLLVGGVFVYAGAPKVVHVEQFALAVSNYRLLPENLVSLVALIVPWLEVVIGVCLLAGLLTRAAAWLSALLSGAFAAAVASAVVRGLDIECGCFSGPAPVDWPHVGFNLLTLAVSLYLARVGAGAWSADCRWQLDETPLED
ncbi:MAG: MauE/DoxX family redox-associated membrane protein [Vulcanimicrobiota bacterium]